MRVRRIFVLGSSVLVLRFLSGLVLRHGVVVAGSGRCSLCGVIVTAIHTAGVRGVVLGPNHAGPEQQQPEQDPELLHNLLPLCRDKPADGTSVLQSWIK